MNKVQWKKNNGLNEVLTGENFYISYNPNTNIYGAIFSGDESGEETAICLNDGSFAILNGDFRKEYEKIAEKGLKECIKFFKSKRDKYESSWSTFSK